MRCSARWDSTVASSGSELPLHCAGPTESQGAAWICLPWGGTSSTLKPPFLGSESSFELPSPGPRCCIVPCPRILILGFYQPSPGLCWHCSASWPCVLSPNKRVNFLWGCWEKWTLIHCSVQFNHSAASNSLWPHELQHSRPPCSSPTPGVYSNSCPLSPWCHQAISSSVVPFSSCLQSFPASGSFQMSQLFASGSQSIGVSASTSVIPVNTPDWSPLGWTGWISLQSKGLSCVM